MRLDDDSRPPYQQLADSLRDGIGRGEFPPGSQLPSIAELAERHQVAKGTVQAALRVLRDSGLVVARHGKGVFVRTDANVEEPEVSLSAVVRQVQDLTEHLRRLTERVEELEQASRRQ
ncbi:GntR family transcriptional regulator [Micromonospora sp. HM5-17]|jgi:DNA-binding GntR family transcriptional regulator|uniref:GntR family transcriptional regulator n=1 Tax=Micromonospora sp. HM5-17 TaxID=2487710 RepID=UPI000F47392B|nr:winged helix-turn-helix domain-containing protein [Micromonospora sp. HM5-17]ROT25619.1 GntR family transcriptional regulator [Micromonospora sp. HM5-17]